MSNSKGEGEERWERKNGKSKGEMDWRRNTLAYSLFKAMQESLLIARLNLCNAMQAITGLSELSSPSCTQQSFSSKSPNDGVCRRKTSPVQRSLGSRASVQELIKLILHNGGGGNEVFVTSSAVVSNAESTWTLGSLSEERTLRPGSN